MAALKKNGRFGIGLQSEEGTGVVPTDYFRLLSGNLDLTPNIVEIEETGGRDNTDYEQIGYDASFEIEVAFNASVSHHKLLYWFLGAIDESGAGPTYTHEATRIESVAETNLLSISFDRGVVLSGTDETLRLVDCFFDEFRLSPDQRGIVKATITGRATAYEEAAPLSPTYPAVHRYNWGHYSLLMADYPDSPTQLATAREATVTLQNNNDFDAFTADGSTQPDMPEVGSLVAMIEVEKQLTASDPLYLAFKAGGTRKNVSMLLSRTVGANTWSTRIDLSNAIMRTLEWPEISGSSERGYMKGQFTGVNDGTTDAVVATMVDTEETY